MPPKINEIRSIGFIFVSFAVFFNLYMIEEFSKADVVFSFTDGFWMRTCSLDSEIVPKLCPRIQVCVFFSPNNKLVVSSRKSLTIVLDSTLMEVKDGTTRTLCCLALSINQTKTSLFVIGQENCATKRRSANLGNSLLLKKKKKTLCLMQEPL